MWVFPFSRREIVLVLMSFICYPHNFQGARSLKFVIGSIRNSELWNYLHSCLKEVFLRLLEKQLTDVFSCTFHQILGGNLFKECLTSYSSILVVIPNNSPINCYSKSKLKLLTKSLQPSGIIQKISTIFKPIIGSLNKNLLLCRHRICLINERLRFKILMKLFLFHIV
jgi:hypothetical protein